jgi:hypothetical protein
MQFGRTIPHVMALACFATIPLFPKPSEFRGAPKLVYGTATQLGTGHIRTYMEYDNGRPVELGVELTEGVMQGLPHHGFDPASGVHGAEYVLELPQGNPTPFKHVVVQWNPGGHEPPGMYDLPHFDFHFYTIDNAARLAISPKDQAFEQKAANQPQAEFLPPGYILPAPLAIPAMGVHWIDPKSPEFNGGKFTQTFIFGSYDGQMIFAEPMITRSFLETKETVVRPLPVAAKYSPAGLYPAAYAIRWVPEAKVWRVALSELTARN